MKRGIEFLQEAKTQSLSEDSHQQFLNLPVPFFPFPELLNDWDRMVWDWLVADAWRPSLEAGLRNFIPLVRGDLETSGNVVDNFLHEENRKRIRQKGIFEKRLPFIKSELHPEPEEKEKAPDPDVSALLLKVLRQAKKRWGAKAVKALRYHSKGGTIKESAKRAGIEEWDLRRYIEKLNLIFFRQIQ